MRPPRAHATRPGRPDRRRDRAAARPRPDARAAARSRPLAGERQGARAADRPEPAFLRLGPAAWPPRAGSPGAGLLHGRRQELRAGADLPHADRLRAGPLGRGGDRRRYGRGGRRTARPARDWRVLVPTRSGGPAAGCCGGPAPAGVDACCVADAEAKETTGQGCGCGTSVKAAARVPEPA